ncbi:hypothetical protein K458DRAFT_383052 [Lentithecium fluviatile CBS 122367]|uniref:Uncharacterized protein n=1 Tax=Lentithecium fluviatile CBS 122367 TaxID=1168545 RepID=A0A6G1JIC6_9PLEO|nr:hypothetical protein K458DRAFT_383052 [Lentithecium fluviatile CBS 122367]
MSGRRGWTTIRCSAVQVAVTARSRPSRTVHQIGASLDHMAASTMAVLHFGVTEQGSEARRLDEGCRVVPPQKRGFEGLKRALSVARFRLSTPLSGQLGLRRRKAGIRRLNEVISPSLGFGVPDGFNSLRVGTFLISLQDADQTEWIPASSYERASVADSRSHDEYRWGSVPGLVRKQRGFMQKLHRHRHYAAAWLLIRLRPAIPSEDILEVYSSNVYEGISV